MADLVAIASDRLRAAIDPFGAELVSLTDADGRELMTDADPAYWTGHAPILFPIVGRLNGDTLRLDGAEYTMPKHGFARRSAFQLVEGAANQAIFRLEDNEETRVVYPFAFALDLCFTLHGATLAIEATLTNRGDAALPASFGFHPAFAWPLPYGRARAEHRIEFAADEPAPLRVLTPGGLVAAGERPSPLEGRTLALADALFTDDALIWSPVASRSVTYGAPGAPQLRVDFPDTHKLGIWTKPVPSGAEGPGAAFICIEPWHGIADPEGFAGDFRAKPGVFEVAPSASKRIGMSVTLEG